ncbi:MAG: DUF3291 domain-containing protein [Chitinophagaceae bacterium]|nr:MAG: DUF3291 domain-containing protein [Chitinophagaceae bacterium]
MGWLKGYTLTVWKTIDDMKNFRNTGPHKEAMRNVKRLTSRYKTFNWETESVPGWEEATEQLIKIEFVELS